MKSMHKPGDSNLYGIIGFPLGHTASPAMQNSLFKHYGMSSVYVPVQLPVKQLEDFFSTARFLFRGLNVTVPYKKEVISYVDKLDKHSAAIGSINTIKNEKNILKGYNTDFIGLHHALKKNLSITLKRKNVCILGAGGAASSAVYLALQEGAKSIVIVNRTLKRAIALAAHFKSAGVRIFVASKDTREACDHVHFSEVIINTTSLGLRSKDALPVKKSILKKNQYVFDMIYNPPITKLLANAKEKGCKTANGLDMLVYQGAEAFKIWTGKKPDPAIMRKAAKKMIYQ